MKSTIILANLPHRGSSAGEKLTRTNTSDGIRAPLGSIRDTAFADFVSNAVPVHLLAEYVYCAAKVPNRKIQGDIRTPVLLEGQRIHEAEAKRVLAEIGPTKRIRISTVFDAMVHAYRNITVALRKRKVLANSEKRVFFLTVLSEYGIVGRPDAVDCRDGKNPVIIETKTTDKMPLSPWPDNELQVGIYMMGLERLGFQPTHGVLEYVKRNSPKQRKRYTIPLNAGLRQEAVSAAKTVVNLLLEKEEPIATKNPRKCIPYRFVSSCQWKPTVIA